MDGTFVDKRCEILFTPYPPPGCCFHVRNSLWDKADILLPLFSMKCMHPFASAAGHHTSHTILGFSFFSAVLLPALYAASSRNHRIVFNIELFCFLLG